MVAGGLDIVSVVVVVWQAAARSRVAASNFRMRSGFYARARITIHA
jgi:hypothetical protein